MNARGFVPFVAAIALACATGAHAQTPADSTFRDYVRGLSDSTDAYFGRSVAPPDTTGLDSTLAYLLANPKAQPDGRRRALDVGPWLRWNRGDGPVTGLATAFGSRRRAGEVAGRLAWAHGTDVLHGRAEYRKRWWNPDTRGAWEITMGGGRESRAFEREHFNASYSTVRAALFGGDRHDHVRTDGWRAALARVTPAARVHASWRDELESPLPVTATWTLTGARAVRRDMAAAWPGRARELELGARSRMGRWPLTLAGTYATSGDATGSDFTYRRMRVAAEGDFSLGGRVAIVPSFEWRRLRGEAVPQSAFSLGGGSSLVTLDGNALHGTGHTRARLDAVLVDDVLELLHVPHPAVLPLQVGAFAASGAVWGRTPAGTIEPYADVPAVTARDWPERREWLSEAGVSVLYRPGLPDPSLWWRFDWAWPIGADAREPRFTFGMQKMLKLGGGGDGEE